MNSATIKRTIPGMRTSKRVVIWLRGACIVEVSGGVVEHGWRQVADSSNTQESVTVVRGRTVDGRAVTATIVAERMAPMTVVEWETEERP